MSATPPPVTDRSGPDGRAVRVARVVLVVAGVAGLTVGGWKLTALHGYQLRALGVWLVSALVLHDGVLVPAVTLALVVGSLVLGRLAGRGVRGHRWRAPRGAGTLVATCLAVGGVLTLVVLPELHAQSLGPANPTVVPGDYGRHLVLTWVVLAVVAVAGTLTLGLRDRARRRKPPPGVSRARP
ncbi:hypothetical protein ACFT5B_08525 [Luteimicrobium sp. NPDC057192]|uniref:hypothetical protein n=1 Tax=Luteimicrobium sp. NPDC057192 TaxID=3346042 RepID=UPI00363B6AFF